jgi:hypothetical protein
VLSPKAYQLRVAVIAGLCLVACGVMFLAVTPFEQPLWYHNFADSRSFWQVPNALNVLSNLPYVLVGLLGLYVLVRFRPASLDGWGRRSYAVFFALIALTGIGSAYYHAEPDNDRLLWDRLPLAMAFMAFLAIMIAERMSPRAGRMLFWPLIILGAASVFQWHASETRGAGDLRLYLLVQFLPLFVIPLMLLLFPAPYTLTGDLFAALACYIVAKLLEILDRQVFAQGGLVSGHTLKHLVSGLAPLFILHMVRYRVAATQASACETASTIPDKTPAAR